MAFFQRCAQEEQSKVPIRIPGRRFSPTIKRADRFDEIDGLKRNHRVGMNIDKMPEEEAREERSDPAFEFWSDEGARLFNEMVDEGSAYTAADVRLSGDFEVYVKDDRCDYRDPELYDPDEETLPLGEMELIFENSYVM